MRIRIDYLYVHSIIFVNLSLNRGTCNCSEYQEGISLRKLYLRRNCVSFNDKHLN